MGVLACVVSICFIRNCQTVFRNGFTISCDFLLLFCFSTFQSFLSLPFHLPPPLKKVPVTYMSVFNQRQCQSLYVEKEEQDWREVGWIYLSTDQRSWEHKNGGIRSFQKDFGTCDYNDSNNFQLLDANHILENTLHTSGLVLTIIL